MEGQAATPAFRAGECYYRLLYLDGTLTQPVIDTYVYLGMNLSEEEEDTWYFQDTTSYNVSGPVTESGDENASVFSFKVGELGSILDLYSLTQELIANLKRQYGSQ